jgi:hypothetical protein
MGTETWVAIVFGALVAVVLIGMALSMYGGSGE